jgi:hypothetical protein
MFPEVRVQSMSGQQASLLDDADTSGHDADLQSMMAAKGLSDQVHVRHFHKWCLEQNQGVLAYPACKDVLTFLISWCKPSLMA